MIAIMDWTVNTSWLHYYQKQKEHCSAKLYTRVATMLELTILVGWSCIVSRLSSIGTSQVNFRLLAHLLSSISASTTFYRQFMYWCDWPMRATAHVHVLFVCVCVVCVSVISPIFLKIFTKKNAKLTRSVKVQEQVCKLPWKPVVLIVLTTPMHNKNCIYCHSTPHHQHLAAMTLIVVTTGELQVTLGKLHVASKAQYTRCDLVAYDLVRRME